MGLLWEWAVGINQVRSSHILKQFFEAFVVVTTTTAAPTTRQNAIDYGAVMGVGINQVSRN